jgi:ferrochelatase
MALPLGLLVNLGTPRAPTPEGVREFLREFLSDPAVVDWPRWLWLPVLERAVLRKRPQRLAALYASIWTEAGAPLAAGTQALARAVQHELAGRCEVRACYRYGEASLARELESARAQGRRAAVLALFPQRTSSSSGTIEALVSAQAAPTASAPCIARLAPDEPGYIAALAQTVRAALAAEARASEHLLVSFHGIPRRYDRRERGQYRADCGATFEALLAALDWPRARASLAYQSRFGPEAWLTPATAAEIPRLARAGVRGLCVATPGFLTDGLESLEEIGLRGRELFLAAGGLHFARAAAPAPGPPLSAALARALMAALEARS